MVVLVVREVPELIGTFPHFGLARGHTLVYKCAVDGLNCPLGARPCFISTTLVMMPQCGITLLTNRLSS